MRSIPAGQQAFTAVGVFSDQTIQDVTAIASWASSDETIATVSSAAGSAGLATGLGPGVTTISATLGVVTGTMTLQVVGSAVASTFPRDGVAGIRASAPILLTFNQAIDPASLTTHSVGPPAPRNSATPPVVCACALGR
ncbi:MAG TPA: Ig-like domain-containing protein [Kofleriaceae bacterium]|nr:Ig-like domain-containing protein [Kofleriaceae bacterium]